MVGESPVPNGWRLSGRAFYTVDNRLIPSGKNLNALLKTYDLNIEMCGFTELVKCYVGKNTKLFWSCGEKCWPIFERQVNAFDFRILITLGVKTLALINRQLKTNFEIGNISAVRIRGKEYQLLPIYHPSPINPSNHQKNLSLFEKLSNELQSILL